jgi:hypothetical protein
MRRIFSISAILMLMYSAALPSVMSAMMANGAAMACHRPTLGTGAAAPQHCHDMADMAGDDAMEGRPADGASITSSTDQKCPMDCCTMMGTAQQAVLPVQRGLPALAIMEHGISIARVVFSRTGFSSHTDRGPPSA